MDFVSVSAEVVSEGYSSTERSAPKSEAYTEEVFPTPLSTKTAHVDAAAHKTIGDGP